MWAILENMGIEEDHSSLAQPSGGIACWQRVVERRCLHKPILLAKHLKRLQLRSHFPMSETTSNMRDPAQPRLQAQHLQADLGDVPRGLNLKGLGLQNSEGLLKSKAVLVL